MPFAPSTATDAASALLVPLGAEHGVLAWTPVRQTASEPGATDDASVLAALVRSGALHAAEADLAFTLPTVRRSAFVAGRIALRAAIVAVAPGQGAEPHLPARPLLRTTRGAPALPPGVLGSISHKRTHAVAIALASEPGPGHLGIDLENRPQKHDPPRPSIASRILTPREQDQLSALREFAHADATRLRFALKEAVYKAIDPIVERYVSFTEVEVDVFDDGRVDVHLLLPELVGQGWQVAAQWRRDARWILATARSHR